MSFFSLRRKSGFVGVDLGTFSVKVVDIAPGTPPEVRSLGQVRLPRGSILGGIYKDLETISEKLHFLVKNLGLKDRPAVISISSYAAIIKRFDLQVPQEKDVEAAIYEEAEAHVPFDLDDVYLDYQIFSEENDLLDILLVAAKKELIDNLQEIITNAGLIPAIGDVDVIALSNLVEYLYQPQETSLIIDFGASKTSVILWQNNSLVATRDIGKGSLEVNDLIQDKLNLSFEESEQLKLGNSEKKEEIEVAKKIQKKFYEGLIDDIKGTIDYFKSLYPNCQIEKIYISGGGANFPNIDKLLANRLEIKTQKITPLSKVKLNPKINEKSIDYFQQIIGIAISLGIRELLS